MYFWKIKDLKDELIKNGLSQKSIFIYILLYVLLGQLFVEVSCIFPSEEVATTTDYIQMIFDLAVVGIGTYLCFYANGSDKGQQFSERYFSIGFVVGLRFMVLLLPIVIVFGIVAGILSETSGLDLDGPVFNYGVLVIVSAWLVAMYWRIIAHINDVAKAENV